MKPASPPPRRGLEAFASRDFRRYQLARVAVVLGAEAQSVAVAWQVYSITHRAIDLGYTGLALFLPGLIFLLPAGHVADRFDRRHVILTCYALQVFCTAALVMLARNNTQNILAIYAVLFFVGTGRAFSGPASSALIPHLVPETHFVNAVTWGGAIFQLANITGPALGGLLFTFPLAHFVPDSRLEGAGIVYVFTLGTLGWFLVLVSTLHVRPGRMEHRATFAEGDAGGLSIRAARADAAGIVFAGSVRGAAGRGRGADADFCARHSAPGAARAGHAARGAGGGRGGDVAGDGAVSHCAAARGAGCLSASRSSARRRWSSGCRTRLWLSLASLAVAGAADTISVIIRGSLLQLATPPEMRGRVSAVNSLFIGASNELGEFESGLTAQWWGAVRATVIGGLGALAVAGTVGGDLPQPAQGR